MKAANIFGVSHVIAHLFFGTGSCVTKDARVASTKTSCNPFCVSAEHSIYFTAPSSRANFSAASIVIGFCFTLESFSIVEASSRKSIIVPTNKNGVFGQWCIISGTHCIEDKGGNRRSTPWYCPKRQFWGPLLKSYWYPLQLAPLKLWPHHWDKICQTVTHGFLMRPIQTHTFPIYGAVSEGSVCPKTKYDELFSHSRLG